MTDHADRFQALRQLAAEIRKRMAGRAHSDSADPIAKDRQR